MYTESRLWGVAAPTRQRSEHRVRLGVAAAARGAAGRRAGRDARGPRPPWRRLSTHTTRADIMIWRQSECILSCFTTLLPAPSIVRMHGRTALGIFVHVSHRERQGNGVGVWVAGTGKKAPPATTGLLSTSAPRHTTIPDQREYLSTPHTCKLLPVHQPFYPTYTRLCFQSSTFGHWYLIPKRMRT